MKRDDILPISFAAITLMGVASMLGDLNATRGTKSEVVDETEITQSVVEEITEVVETQIEGPEPIKFTKPIEEVVQEDMYNLRYMNAAEVINFGEYKGLVVEAFKQTITEEEAINWVNATLLTQVPSKEVVARIGDSVNISFKESSGREVEDYQLVIGEGTQADGLEEALVGMMPGEEKTTKIKLKGVTTEVDLTLNYVYKAVPYEDVTLEQLNALGYIYNDKQEFLETQKDIANYVYEIAYWNTIGYSIINQLVTNATWVEEPITLINEIANVYVISTATYAEENDMTLDEYLSKSFQQTVDDFNAEARVVAEDYVKKLFIAQAIAEKEGIEISSSELATRAKAQLSTYGYENIKEMFEHVKAEDFYVSELCTEIGEKLINDITVIEPVVQEETHNHE